MKCVLYSRVSTYRQVQYGMSLDAQEDTLLKWAELKQLEVLPRKSGLKVWAEKGRSGKSLFGRPVLMEALETACREKAVLVSINLTRIGRSVQDIWSIAERLTKSGGGLQLVQQPIDTTTATGRLHMGIMALFAEFEREITSERLMEINTWRRKHNFKMSGTQTLYGYKVSKQKMFGRIRQVLVPHDGEQDVIRRIKEWRSMGRPIKWIARRLNLEGIPTGRKPMNPKAAKSCWWPNTIKNILKREAGRPLMSEGTRSEIVQGLLTS